VVKIVAKLINCTKEEQRSVICFLWTEDVPEPQIHFRICSMDKILSRRIVYEWIEMFKNDHTSVTVVKRPDVQLQP